MSAEGEPKIRDLDLGALLGFGWPQTIRYLIAGLECFAPGEIEKRGDEYWLTEEQAFTVVAKADTPKAQAIFWQMARVYLAVTEGGEFTRGATDD